MPKRHYCAVLGLTVSVSVFLLSSMLGGTIAAQGADDTHTPMLNRPEIDPRFAVFDQLDLRGMPTGDVLARHNIATIQWRVVNGPDVKRVWKNERKVEIRDLALKVNWPKPTNKYEGTLFLIQNCEEVLIENVSIVHMNPDYRGQHSFLLEGCGNVTIRNVYSAGAVDRIHIRLEGCREYLIERVEISGWDYGDAGIRCGAGIFINNGVTMEDGSVKVTASHPHDLDWGVIRDCWIHDYLEDDGKEWRNQDGIGFHAPSNGIVFNCVFDRWKAGDGAIDDSHRRYDPRYRNKVHRIERCIFRDNRLVKTNGATGSPDCVIVWMNNVYINSWMADYHKGWTNWHVHETYLWEDRMPVFVKNWGMRDRPTVFANGLLHVPRGADVVYWQSGKATNEGYRLFRADRMLYLMPEPGHWMRGLGVAITDRQAWLSEGLDRNSVISDVPAGFVGLVKRDLRLTKVSPAVGFGSSAFLNPSDAALRIIRDFNGRQRPDPPAVGAFEPLD